jgi:hypothetical protein
MFFAMEIECASFNVKIALASRGLDILYFRDLDSMLFSWD